MFVDVATNLPIYKNLTYRLPDSLGTPSIGTRVQVPVGSRVLDGLIIAQKETLDNSVATKDVLSTTSWTLSPALLRFYQWLADYYAYPLGCVVHESVPRTWGELPKRAPKVDGASPAPAPEVELTSEQIHAVSKIKLALRQKTFKAFVLDGVTGSGKTEVYFHALKEALVHQQSSLLLVPEIALTPQLVRRFQQFFGQSGLVYHSGLTPARRHRTLWTLFERARLQEPYVLIGTRSAALLPIEPEFIVVDEEHDSSYKQNDHLRYSARDVALMRGRLWNRPVVLGSATPSLESHDHIRQKRYEHLTLKQRPGKAILPAIQLVDLKEHHSHGLLSVPLIVEMKETLRKGEQTILFINRRGFAPQFLCADCAHTFQCQHCDITLTLTKEETSLRCHYCGFRQPVPTVCPTCTSSNFRELGHGTERVEEEVRTLVPKARVTRFDRDTITTPKKLEAALESLRNGEIDILIGTQMIAKGHDFSQVTLVGILQADSYLCFPDFRAAERTFQLLTQVAGRAGRGDKAGKVFIQTFQPEHPAIQAVLHHQRDDFLSRELLLRAEHLYPPFQRLALVRMEGKDSVTLEQTALKLRRALRAVPGIEILGPVVSPLSRLKDQHRMQFLLRSADNHLLHQYLHQMLLPLTQQLKGVHISLDVDPQDLL